MVGTSDSAQDFAESLAIVNGKLQLSEQDLTKFQNTARMTELTNIAMNKSFMNCKSILNEYNNGFKNTNLTQEDFVKAVSSGNPVMAKYINSLNGAKGNMFGYTASLVGARLQTIGLQAASMALNAVIGMGIGLAISAAIKGIDYLVHREDNLIEKSEEAASTIKSLNNSYSSAKQTVDDCTDSFIRLSKGVDLATGKNLTLSDDDYQEFLNVSNQLAETFPTLTRHYDENGNAIVQLNGSASDITSTLQELLETERALANQEIVDNLPDLYKGKKAQSDRYQREIDNISDQIDSLQNIIDISKGNFQLEIGSSFKPSQLPVDDYLEFQKLIDDFGILTNYDPVEDLYTIIDTDINRKVLEEKGNEIQEQLSNFFSKLEKDYAVELNNATSKLANVQNQNAQNWSSLMGSISAYLQTDDAYANLNDSAQSAIQTIINGLDYSSLDFSNWENLKSYIDKDIVSLFKDGKGEPITEFINIQTMFNNNECDITEYKKALNNINEFLSDFDEEKQVQFKVALGIEDSQAKFNQISENLNLDSNKTLKNWISGLNSSELEIVANLSTETESADWELDVWKEKVKGKLSVTAAIDFDITSAEANIENLQKAVQNALTGNSGLTKESKGIITSMFGSLDSFDSAELFERTAGGIRLNTEELNRLQNEQSSIQKQKFDTALKELYKEYNELTDKIKNCSDIQSDEYNSLVENRNAVVDHITSVADLQSEYNGLTSAYLEWQNALTNGEDGDIYDSIRSEFEKATELYEKGLVGTSEFESYMKLITGQNFNDASYEEITKAWNALGKEIDKTGYSIKDFLAEDEKGVMNFLKTASKIKDSGITDSNGFFTIDVDNMSELADKLGVSTEFIESMFRKLRDYKFDIDFKDETDSLEKLVANAQEASQKLRDLGLTDIKFDFTTNDINLLESQISSAKSMFDSLKRDSNGNIDLSVNGAQEVITVYRELLRQKQVLENPIIMDIDISKIEDEDLANNLQQVIDIIKLKNKIELSLSVGENTETLENELKEKIASIDPSENKILFGLDIDENTSYEEIEQKINEWCQNPENAELLLNAGIDGSRLDNEADKIKEYIQNAVDGIEIKLEFDNKILNDLFGSTITIDADTSGAEENLNNLENQKHKTEQDSNFNVNADTSNAETNLGMLQPTLAAIGMGVTAPVDADTSNASFKLGNILGYLRTIAGKTWNAVVSIFSGSNTSENGSTGSGGGKSWLKGTAKINGDYGVKRNESDLIGEIAPELWVHADTGTWEVVDKPQFRKVRKGDVIFDAKQTEDLLKNGSIDSFGNAFLSGTAYKIGVGGGGHSISSTSSSKSSSSKASSSKSSSNSKSSSKDKEDELKAFDWIEIAINRIERAIDRLKNTATSTYKALKTKLGATTSEITKVNQELSLQQKAYNRYIKEANSVGLSSGLATKVRNGTIDINKYSSETQELIKDYQEWYEKALDCKDAIQDLHETLASLYEDKFNDIQNDYDNQLELLEHLTNSYNTGIDKLEAKGYLESTKYYSALQNVEKQNIAIMNKELKDLEKSFSEAMNSGEIEKYSDSWYDMQISINEVKESIDEANVSLLEYSKTMREIEWGYFEYIQDRISQITQESDFLIDLMGNDKLYKDNGQFNDNGMATTGLHAQNYNVYMAQADMYAKKIKDINKDIAKDPYNTDLIKQKEEWVKLQQDSIKAAEDEKKAIVDLVEEGINIELDALKELVDTYKDSLDSAKDLYDYQKKIEDKTKNIASLQKQLSAYENDTSEETKAKLQQIRVELAEAQEDLEETEYEKYISDQKKLLDDMYTEYETILNMRLDNIDALITDMIEMVNNNADTISTAISDMSEDVGYALSDSMKEIWNGDISTIVTNYGDNFTNQLTTVNQALSSIQANVAAMANASNKEASKTISSTSKETKPTKTSSSSKANTNSKNTSTSSNNTSKSKAVTVGGKINAAGAKIYDYAGDKTGEKQYYSKDPKYTVLKVQGDWVQVRHHTLKSGVSGWFKKGDIKAYKTGGLVDYTGLAQLDGTPNKPELVLNANDTKNFLALTEALRNISAQSPISKDFGYPDNFAEIRKISDISDKIMSARNITDTQGVTFGDINIEIPIEHVESYNDFVQHMQKDKKLENMFIDIIGNSLKPNGNSLTKYRNRW